MPLVTELPPEIIHNILLFLEPEDLASVPRTCKGLNRAIRENSTLFKGVYLAHFDTPSTQCHVNWEKALKDLVRLQIVCRRRDVESKVSRWSPPSSKTRSSASDEAGQPPVLTKDKKHELPFVYDTVTEALRNAATEGPRAGATATYPASRNATLLTGLFGSYDNQHAFLERSFLYERARAELPQSETFSSPPKLEHQKSAKLHCLYGVPMLYAHRGSHELRHGKMSPFACSKVYDLRQYTAKTRWGPFMDDGSDRTDWEKVEAIMLVIGANLNRLQLDSFPICHNFRTPFAGPWSGSYLPLGLDEEEERDRSPLELQDPYAVTGTWIRVVCFLDYTDFFDFNFSPEQLPPNVPRRAIDYGEATRLILMRISVTRIEPPGPGDGQALPVVHFRGASRSLDDSWDENANSDLRGASEVRVIEPGTVRLTPEGEVRWTTFSVFSGQERWRSESIQVGGARSARGVIGNWFDKDFDPRGPAGPTAFWKLTDRLTNGRDEHADHFSRFMTASGNQVDESDSEDYSADEA